MLFGENMSILQLYYNMVIRIQTSEVLYEATKAKNWSDVCGHNQGFCSQGCQDGLHVWLT